ncbi:MAG: hypothetical protein MI867_21180 [Pseudomonadales bacterium]|nr:hypothetical protein [Pseudomonadales bacterium]
MSPSSRSESIPYRSFADERDLNNSEPHSVESHRPSARSNPRQTTSLYEVFTKASNNLDSPVEKNAALEAYEGCRTGPVFANYHMKKLYQDLFSGITRNGVSLQQHNGYVYVGIPYQNRNPDPYLLRQVASVIGKNQHIYVFLPDLSPFNKTQSNDDLVALRNALVDHGIRKDRIRFLPAYLFEKKGERVAYSEALSLKLCYG